MMEFPIAYVTGIYEHKKNKSEEWNLMLQIARINPG